MLLVSSCARVDTRRDIAAAAADDGLNQISSHKRMTDGGQRRADQMRRPCSGPRPNCVTRRQASPRNRISCHN